MKRYIWYFVVAIIVVPVLLNIVIGFDAPNNIRVVGDPSVWVQFYGDYIGGIIAAIIAFVALYREGKRNKTSIEIAYKQNAIEELKHALTNCVSLFDYSRVGIIIRYVNQEISVAECNDILREMDEYYNKVLVTANAWGVAYASSEQSIVREFQQAYENCWKFLTCRLNKVMALIIELKQVQNNPKEKERIFDEITKIANDALGFSSMQQRMFSLADQWIRSEEQNLNDLKQHL